MNQDHPSLDENNSLPGLKIFSLEIGKIQVNCIKYETVLRSNTFIFILFQCTLESIGYLFKIAAS